MDQSSQQIPYRVTRATNLLYINVGIITVVSLFDFLLLFSLFNIEKSEYGMPWEFLLGLALVILLSVTLQLYIVSQIQKRKSWARSIFTILFSVFAIVAILTAPTWIFRSIDQVMVLGTSLILGGIALFDVNSKESMLWFRK